jgi:hypothetical protein
LNLEGKLLSDDGGFFGVTQKSLTVQKTPTGLYFWVYDI